MNNLGWKFAFALLSFLQVIGLWILTSIQSELKDSNRRLDGMNQRVSTMEGQLHYLSSRAIRSGEPRQ